MASLNNIIILSAPVLTVTFLVASELAHRRIRRLTRTEIDESNVHLLERTSRIQIGSVVFAVGFVILFLAALCLKVAQNPGRQTTVPGVKNSATNPVPQLKMPTTVTNRSIYTFD